MKMQRMEYLLSKQAYLEDVTAKNSGLSGGQKVFKQVIALLIEGAEYMNEVEVHKFWKINKKQNIDKAKEEAIDCLHFILAIVHNLGITADQLWAVLVEFDPSIAERGDDLDGYVHLADTVYSPIMLSFEDRIINFYSFFVTTLGDILIDLRKNEASVENLAFGLVLCVALCRGVDMTAEEIVEEYAAKNAVNLKRQQDKY